MVLKANAPTMVDNETITGTDSTSTAERVSGRVDRLVRTPGPWKVVRSLTCGHLRAAHNYQSDPRLEWTDKDIGLIEAAPELVEALRELHDFAERSTHYRHEDRSKAAFDRAAELLRKLGE